jgi:hypothetical protein
MAQRNSLLSTKTSSKSLYCIGSARDLWRLARRVFNFLTRIFPWDRCHCNWNLSTNPYKIQASPFRNDFVQILFWPPESYEFVAEFLEFCSYWMTVTYGSAPISDMAWKLIDGVFNILKYGLNCVEKWNLFLKCRTVFSMVILSSRWVFAILLVNPISHKTLIEIIYRCRISLVWDSAQKI